MIWYNNKYLSGFYSMSGIRQTTWWDAFTRQYVGISYWFDVLCEQFVRVYTNWDEYLREGTVNGETVSDLDLDTCMGDVLMQLGSVWAMGLPQLAAMPVITHNFVSPTELDVTWGVQLLGPTDSLDSELYALWSYRINSNLELVDFQWHHSEELNDFLEWQNLVESGDTVTAWAELIQVIWDELGSDVFMTCLENTAFNITIDGTTYYGADCTWESWVGFSEFNSLGLIKAEDNTIKSADGTKVLQKDSINVLATDRLIADAAYILIDIAN